MPQLKPLPTLPRSSTWGLLLIPTLGLLLGLGACQKKEAAAPKALPPASVKVVASRSETVPVNNEYVGRVAAYRSVEVRARVEGILERRHFVEGAEVKKGDLLYTIDPTPYRIALNDAQADQARSAANLASARSKERRLAPLVKENAISQQDYDDAVTAVKQTEALLAVSNANVERGSNQPGLYPGDGHRVRQDRRCAGARGALGGPRRIHPPDHGGPAGPGYVNFNVADRDALILRRELSAGRVKTGEGTGSAQARLFLPDGSEFERSGRLDFSESQVNPSTGTITLRVVMPNPAQKLLPGMYVRVVYTAGARPDTILIPQKAVTKTPTGISPGWSALENKVERRDLVVGEWLKSDWIIEKGLGAGEKSWLRAAALAARRGGEPLALDAGCGWCRWSGGIAGCRGCSPLLWRQPLTWRPDHGILRQTPGDGDRHRPALHVIGVLASTQLAVEQYPNVAPPQVQITATYPGASPETLETTVAAPLEREMNGIAGLLYMQSTSSASGLMQLQVFFQPGTDLDLAAVEVNNRAKRVESLLPQEVLRNGLRVDKTNPQILQVLVLQSEDPRFDRTYIANLANSQVVNELKRLPGARRCDPVRRALCDALVAGPGSSRQIPPYRLGCGQCGARAEPDFAVGEIGQSPADNGQS